MKILVTGSAGFIGFHTSLSLVNDGYEVVGIDNLNNYYDVNLKNKRIDELMKIRNFKFYRTDICDEENIRNIYSAHKFDSVIHLAAQAGVQYSKKNPKNYFESNMLGFFNILNQSVSSKVDNLIYASSSSVYGSNQNYPFKESNNCSTPLSFYAATKLANEVMAHSYSHIYGLKTTGLRFFTVFGPYGRPDMSPFIFADSIINNKIINLYNNGDIKRDFTYITDAVDAIKSIVKNKTILDTRKEISKIYNVGSNSPIKILNFINLFEKFLDKSADIRLKPLLSGDVPETHADINSIIEDYGYMPKTTIEEGVKNFIEWYINYIKE